MNNVAKKIALKILLIPMVVLWEVYAVVTAYFPRCNQASPCAILFLITGPHLYIRITNYLPVTLSHRELAIG